MKVVIECPKNILENELKKDFQISRFKLTDDTLCYITDIDENLYYKYYIKKEHYFNYGSLHTSQEGL